MMIKMFLTLTNKIELLQSNPCIFIILTLQIPSPLTAAQCSSKQTAGSKHKSEPHKNTVACCDNRIHSRKIHKSSVQISNGSPSGPSSLMAVCCHSNSHQGRCNDIHGDN